MAGRLAQKGVRKRVAVICAADESTQQSVAMAIQQGWMEAVMIGRTRQVKQCQPLMACPRDLSFTDAANDQEAAEKAVAMVREGEADLIMKGLVGTDVVLRAILDKERGILPPGNVLTHITAASIPDYHKLLFFTDAAVIPHPTQEQRYMQVKYITQLCRQFGISQPKVALIHCSEKVNAKHFPFTAGYARLIEQAKAGDFGPCIVDGPLDLKVACNLHSMQVKHIDSPIQGTADALVLPDIEAGNLLYKAITLFAHGETACMLQGTQCPVVLPSRGDDVMSKFNSLALACLHC